MCHSFKIDQECRRRAVMPDQIGQQRLHEIIVQRRFTNHCYSKRWDACQRKPGFALCSRNREGTL